MGLAGAVFFFTGIATVLADERLDRTRSAVSEWVAVEQTISHELLAWKEKEASLKDLISVVAGEIEGLESQLEENRKFSSAADERRAELVKQRDEIEKSAQLIRKFLTKMEARVRVLKAQLPQPVQEKLEPFYQRIPVDASKTSLGIAERMQTIVGILSTVQKFDRLVTVAEEVKPLADGSSGEVKTIYLGLGAAYYLAAGGADAGVGVPGKDGWVWESQPELAKAIQETIAIAEGTSQEARFVPLPINLKD